MAVVNGNIPFTPETVNLTTSFFNNYFTDTLSVSQNVDDAVIGYFQTLTGDKDAGINLAAAVIYTSVQQGLDPMSLIDEFRKMKPGELNAYLTMFLNFNRSGTSLLGLSNNPHTSKYITRAILA